MWVEVLCWIDHVWSSKECVWCACDPSVHLDVTVYGSLYHMHECLNFFFGIPATGPHQMAGPDPSKSGGSLVKV